jgi:hypothetical protein
MPVNDELNNRSGGSQACPFGRTSENQARVSTYTSSYMLQLTADGLDVFLEAFRQQ